MEAAADGRDVVLAGVGHEDDAVESQLHAADADVRVLRWPAPEKLSPPVHVVERVVEAVTRYPDRTTGRATARRLAAERREGRYRAAARRVALDPEATQLRRALVRATELREGGVLTARTMVHRVRWSATQRGREPETRAMRALRNHEERAGAVALDIVPRIEQLAPEVVWAVGPESARAASNAVAQLRLSGNHVRFVYDASEDVAVPRDASREAERLARIRLAEERAVARVADLLVARTPALAARLQARYADQDVRVVVLTDRIPPIVGDPPGPLRERLEIGAEAVLLAVPDAHLPGSVEQLHGLTEALAGVPGIHLALLVESSTRSVRALRDTAQARSVADRWHLLEGPSFHPGVLDGADGVVITTDHVAAHPPRAYTAARHAGLAVVAHASPPVVEDLRDHGAGLAVELDDPRAAREGLRTFLESRSVLAARARRSTASQPQGSVGSVLEGLDGASARPAGRVAAPAAVPRVLGERRLTPEPERRVLGVGPANFAGQGWAWAKAAAAALPGLRTEVFAVNQGLLTFPADRHIARRNLRALSWQLDEQRRVLSRYTHLLAEANRPIFGHLNGETLAADLPALRRAGLRLGIALHGSDVRDPKAHRDREKWSPFRENDEFFERVSEFVAKTQRLLADFDGPVFVSTPDLLQDVPHGIWLPVVVDLHAPTGEPPMSRQLPVVLHVPSRSRLKGSADIDEILAGLHDEGVLEYRRLSGVAPADMPGVLASADVVLDQFAIGSYGVLACEAMAAGRVVVGHVRDDVRQMIGEELPIVEATPDDVEEVLRRLFADPDAARRTAAAGRAFVERVHDGARSGAMIVEHLLDDQEGQDDQG